MIENVTDDAAHRELAESMLRSAADANGIAVSSVEFGEWDREASYSWLCYVGRSRR